MNKKDVATHLKEYIIELLPWAHGHQIDAIVDFVAAILEKQTANQAELARQFGNQEAATRRLSRLIHNDLLSPSKLAEAVFEQALAQVPRSGSVRLAIDWTEEGQHHLLVVSLVTSARALPIYWRAYSASSLKGRMRRYEMAVIKRVLTRIRKVIGGRRLRITADRGFADVNLMELLESFGVEYIIRVRKSTKVWLSGGWQNLKNVRFQGAARHRSLGRVYYCERHPHPLYVGMSRARNKERKWEVWYLITNRKRSAKQMAEEYRRRFGCEEGFRDVKWEMGFSEARIKDVKAWSRMFALFAIGLLIVVTLGMKLLVKGSKEAFTLLRKVASRRKGRWDLSLVSAMISLVQVDNSLFEHLSTHTKLLSEATLPNVS